MADPRSVTVSVTFEAVVLTVESCSIDGQTVKMSKGAGNKWTGSAAIVPSPEARPFRLRFRAPSNTDYEGTVKARKKNALEFSGTSDRAVFTVEDDVTIPLAADA
jgi:hypothetical protein